MTITETPRLPENAGKFVPVQTRSERPTSFNAADFPVPNGREVDWKYAPVRALAPLFEDAPGDGTVQVTVSGAAQAQVGKLAPGEAPRGTGFVPEGRAEAIASSHAEATYVLIPEGVELPEPVYVYVTGAGEQTRDLVHLVLHAAANSKATIVVEHTGAAQVSENVEIILDEGADLDVIAVHEWENSTVHTGAHQAVIGKDAKLNHTVVTFGGKIVRVNPSLHLNGAGAEGYSKGLYFSDAGQHFEHQVYIDHAGPNTVSDVNYKGALQGENARAVWVGDVLIRNTATGTQSYEQNRNLLLSDGARADSMPNLEIETGDIKGAGHASATGRFEQGQLFYLMARGIDELTARRLVVHGFLNEVLQSISVPELQDRMRETLERELEASAEAMMAARVA